MFEFKRGHYQQEREIIKELFRQNARTLPVQFSSSPVPDQTQITCDYLQGVKVPTLYIVGENTHDYWQLMTRKFATLHAGCGAEGVLGRESSWTD
ncbi:MAG: hypothetical protein R3E89_10305 [Thiolinea sp.]